MARSRFLPLVSRDTLVLWGFVAFAALTGGGSRADIQSLVLLRPVSFLVLGYAWYRMGPEDWRGHRWVILLFGAAAGLAALQLVPLPPSLWRAMPGRELMARVDDLAGLSGAWRPLSLAPAETRNALFSLAAPAAALLLSLRQTGGERRATLGLFLAIGLLSGLLGLAQVAGPDRSPLYLYRNTDHGSGVGLFANRNHQAMFLACLLPLIAAVAAGRESGGERWRLGRSLAWAAVAVLVPMLLITGSRTGVLLGAVGLLAAAAFAGVRPHAPAGSRGPAGRRFVGGRALLAIGLSAVAGLTALTAWSGRGAAMDRLLASSADGELRPAIWSVSADMARRYFPWGTGYGSFADAFRIDEPRAMLLPRFRNHAHNEVIEVALTGGLPGLALLAGGLGLFGLGAWRAWSTGGSGAVPAKAGSAVLFMLGLASLVDYPFRVPLLACVAACAAAWLGASGGQRPGERATGAGGRAPPLSSPIKV